MNASPMKGKVVAVCCNSEAGSLVRHRYLANKDPSRPNLRQALLVDAAVFAELAERDIHVGPGMMGENITIEGIDVMQ